MYLCFQLKPNSVKAEHFGLSDAGRVKYLDLDSVQLQPLAGTSSHFAALFRFIALALALALALAHALALALALALGPIQTAQWETGQNAAITPTATSSTAAVAVTESLTGVPGGSPTTTFRSTHSSHLLPQSSSRCL